MPFFGHYLRNNLHCTNSELELSLIMQHLCPLGNILPIIRALKWGILSLCTISTFWENWRNVAKNGFGDRADFKFCNEYIRSICAKAVQRDRVCNNPCYSVKNKPYTNFYSINALLFHLASLVVLYVILIPGKVVFSSCQERHSAKSANFSPKCIKFVYVVTISFGYSVLLNKRGDQINT